MKPPRMNKPVVSKPLLRMPRLLPLTIAAMVALLLVKSVTLVQAAAAEVAGATAPAVDSAANLESLPAKKQDKQKAAVSAPDEVAIPQAVLPKSITSDAALPVSEAERAVLLDLRKRRQALDARMQALDQREAEINAAGRQLTARVEQLARLQARLEELEAGRQQHRAENWAGLVKVYESMKPRDAAAIFDALDMQVLLQVMDRMAERKLAPVLAAMQSDRARLATQLLAEMRTRATTPATPKAESGSSGEAVPTTPNPKG